MKKAGLIIFCIVLIAVGGGRIVISKLVDNVNSIPVKMPDLSYLNDGKYIGEYSAGPVNVKVEVTLENGKLTNIDIVKHNNGLGGSAESIVNSIVDKQSLDVDVISGATVSSKCILKAVENAVSG